MNESAATGVWVQATPGAAGEESRQSQRAGERERAGRESRRRLRGGRGDAEGAIDLRCRLRVTGVCTSAGVDGTLVGEGREDGRWRRKKGGKREVRTKKRERTGIDELCRDRSCGRVGDVVVPSWHWPREAVVLAMREST